MEPAIMMGKMKLWGALNAIPKKGKIERLKKKKKGVRGGGMR
jgi:hypothetical protein